MQFFLKSRINTVAIAVLAIALSQFAYGQGGQSEAKGMPPRATPNDYQAHAQAGTFTIAAEFQGHSVATPESIFTNENFVTIEVGLFGPPQARLRLSFQDFSLRINGKKAVLPAQQFGLAFKALKDPAWIPPVPAGPKSKGGISAGGDNPDSNAPPPVVHVPIEVERAMEQKVQKAALPEGERQLPQAGLIFFEYGGKLSGIHSVELLYSGPAGKVVVPLQ
jgi:hypothetical protein